MHKTIESSQTLETRFFARDNWMERLGCFLNPLIIKRMSILTKIGNHGNENWA